MLNLIVLFSIMVVQSIIFFVIYKTHKTLIHPSLVIQMFYTIQIVIALAIFWEYSFSLQGIIWILIALFSFSIGGLLSNSLLRKRFNISDYSMLKKSINININNSIWILKILLVVSFLYPIDLILRNNISLSSLLNFQNLLALNNEMAVARYAGDSEHGGIFSRLLLTFVYLTPLVAGFNINFFTNIKHKKLCWLSFIPAGLVLLVTNTKAGLIACVILFACGYMTSLAKKNKKLPKLSIKYLIMTLFLGFSFFGILFLSMVMRTGRFDAEIIERISSQFILYAFGSIPAFDIWFSEFAHSVEHYFGTITFYGLADFFGIRDRVQGIFNIMVHWSTWRIWSTNVFTTFRSLIEDFGPILSLAIMFILGLVMDISFTRVYTYKKLNTGIFILITFYFWSLYGFITSPWSYMSFTLAFILFGFYGEIISIKHPTIKKIEEKKYVKNRC